MPARRRPLRLTVATSVLFVVIAALVIIVARGPSRFFAATNVRAGVSCTVRHCPATEDEPAGPELFRKQQQ